MSHFLPSANHLLIFVSYSKNRSRFFPNPFSRGEQRLLNSFSLKLTLFLQTRRFSPNPTFPTFPPTTFDPCPIPSSSSPVCLPPALPRSRRSTSCPLSQTPCAFPSAPSPSTTAWRSSKSCPCCKTAGATSGSAQKMG